VNDRGPFHSERIIDLSYTAALKLGYIGQGSTQVEIEQVRGDGSVPPGPVLVASAPTPAATPAGAPAATANPVTPTQQPTLTTVNTPPGPVAGTQVASTQVASNPSPAPGTGMGMGAGSTTPPVVVTTPVTEARATTPPPGTPVQALPTSTQPDGVYLQLGAFGARDGADEFRTKVYQQLGWLNDTIYIVARDRLFRVQLGPYKDRVEAGAVAEKIRQSLQFTPMFILK
jgi:rare lipoprotein A